MSASTLSRKPLTLLRRCALVAIVIVTCFAGKVLRAQEQAPHYLSDNIVEKLSKLDEMQKEKKWDEMIALIKSLYQTSKPESYDAAMMLQYLGNVYLIKNDLASALSPLEEGLALSEKYHYYHLETEQQVRYYVAQIYYQDATAKNVPNDVTVRDLKKAKFYLDQWFANNTRPNPDARVFDASVLFQLAQSASGVPNKYDPTYLKETMEACQAGFTETVHPKEYLYLLYINCLQLQERYAEAASYWEILVNVQPSKKDYWNQLLATYNQLAQSTDPRVALKYSVRALLTLDRAQAHGFLKSPRENFIRFSILYNIQQYQEAAHVLRAGLENGSIEDTAKNWEILAYALQQVNKSDEAIDVLKEACKRYPTNGQFYFTIAQDYYAKDNSKMAYEYAQRALKVGHLDKPYTVESFIAYIAFDLRKYDDGLAAVDKALSYPEGAKDARLKSLKSAMLDEIRRREQNKKAIEAQRRSL